MLTPEEMLLELRPYTPVYLDGDDGTPTSEMEGWEALHKPEVFVMQPRPCDFGVCTNGRAGCAI